ncbi:MAG: hypothetical protein IPM66_14400 [Acidobacteriota bacterium]|nr:MAG: hypothetical protein IPM66_14400 [Acidobacteriota bacterium]
MFIDLMVNLIAVLIGGLTVRGYTHVKGAFSRRASKWFWAPTKSKKIYIYYEGWTRKLLDVGEYDSVVNILAPFSVGELRLFLLSYYKEVVVTIDQSEINWDFPVVSLGGPLHNSLTEEAVRDKKFPLWFTNLPYDQHSIRTIGDAEGKELYRSTYMNNDEVLSETNKLTSDVGFVARVQSSRNKQQFLYIVAANYGPGTWGIVRYLTSLEKLKQLYRRCSNDGFFKKVASEPFFQIVIRSYISGTQVTDTQFECYRIIQ